MDDFYDMIFKRKSMRRFDLDLQLTNKELEMVKRQIHQLNPLDEKIHIETELVPKDKTSCKRGEYCLLIYSDVKPNYLLNVGYIFEQLDLYLASEDIGVCWYGFGKPEAMKKEGLEFVIMMALGKCHPKEFRQNMYKSKRKSADVLWKGEFDTDISNIVRFAPSACNMQPWRVQYCNGKISVFRSTSVSSMMPKAKRPYYNTIDMVIFLCFLEILLKKKSYQFKRRIFDAYDCKDNSELKVAEYRII